MQSFGSRFPIFLFAAAAALAQISQPAPPQPMPANADPAFDVATIQPGESGTKQWKFAVVSIRKNNSGGPQHIGVATADGYEMKNLYLWYLLLMAYVPQSGGAALYSTDQFMGMPAWLTGDDDRYDLDAKVDEADLADGITRPGSLPCCDPCCKRCSRTASSW
jgi:hypothetical protein